MPPSPERLPFWARVSGTGGSVPDGWKRPSPGARGLRADVPIALLLGVTLVLAERFSSFVHLAMGTPERVSPQWAIIAIPIMAVLALSFRRIAPISSMAVSVAAMLIGQVAPYADLMTPQVVCFIGIYSAAAWSRRRMLATVANLLVLALFTAYGIVGTQSIAMNLSFAQDDVALSILFGGIINVLFVVAAMVFGANDHRRAGEGVTLRLRTAELAERTAALEAERRLVAEQAVRLDRVAIARELHDVVAHHVSLMGLQAGVARRALTSSPDRVEGALETIEGSAREAIGELQQLLTTLRDPEYDVAAPPSTQSIEQVPALIAQRRDAGMRIEDHVFGESRSVPPLVGFTVFRVLQEALTNADKHAPGAEVDVRLRYLDDGLELDVTNDAAPGTRADRSGGGRGLLGMRERVHAVGGTLEASPRQGGGFRVVASLPAPSH